MADTIPGEGKSVDGMSNVAGRRIEPFVDWVKLEREFMLQQEYKSVTQWLYSEKGWTVKKIKSGNTTNRTTGWSKKRATLQQKITQAAIEKAIDQERKLIPELRNAKAALIARIMKDVGNWDRLNGYDKNLCYQIIKVELREPTNVKDLPPADARDPVEALLEEYGLMKDGVIIDDDPESDRKLISGPDSPQAEATDSTSLAEVSQD